MENSDILEIELKYYNNIKVKYRFNIEEQMKNLKV